MSEHRDFTDYLREVVEQRAAMIVGVVHGEMESLAIAREVMIKAFDEEAERLDRKAAMDGLIEMSADELDESAAP